MRSFPKFVGNVVNWINDAISIQDANVREYEGLNRQFPLLGVQTIDWDPPHEINTEVNPVNCYRFRNIDADGTVTAANIGKGNSGRTIQMVFENDSTAPRTVTFGTGFSPTASLVGSTAYLRTVTFVEVNGILMETARTDARPPA